jgi:copper transport outer membrane protein MctB
VGQLDLFDTEAFLVINFRYHVVSLTAVFFALAIGLIVGTAALNGPAADELHNQVNSLSDSNKQLRARLNTQTSEVNNQEQFATEVAPQLLAGKLTGRRVLIVSMQGATSLVAPIVTDLGLAGAKITGQIEIEDKFVDPSNNSDLIDRAERADPPSITGLPTNSVGVETSSGLLAAALVDRNTIVSAAAREEVLSTYEADSYISVNGSDKGDVTGPAEVVLFLVPPPFDDSNASDENQYMVTIATEFRSAAPLVVGSAGASGSGNVIGAVIADASLSATVSTVNNVDTAEGQIAAGLALNEQLVASKTGHYGLAAGATSLVPKWPEG